MKLVGQLAHILSISEQDTLRLILNAPFKYRVYTIPKRTHGRRVIAQPTKVVKKLQKGFISLYNFPVHSRCMAYRKGLSIKHNAEMHLDNSYLLKMDLSDFFNSLTPKIFWNTWKEFWQLPDGLEQRLIESIIFWNNNSILTLSVGAPSSPAISNFCLYPFDEKLDKYCIEKGIAYTRYADDLTFSTKENNLLFILPSIVSGMLHDIFGGSLTINNKKTVFSSKAHNRHVTGITITNEGSASIGRERKRYIKHLLNKYKFNELNSNDINHLRGLLAFAFHIEPDLLTSLSNKYTHELLEKLKQEGE
ncbi:retron St85 family RNA-directed DNA polymerase [Enterobacter cloacae]|uniref:retron St85 family RNA-directed DNA polymerase n=1 Tax=Enterobacter cloacae TaxID=550 RepID=UPI002004746F|nr:retron St85 family RNA-directed DNA polymerase [Enterobacter cloacae]MCK7265654.1 retron St85 family RNA-directed DNA polymerase [Enterobacter cloacae]HBL4972089.1 retron St85 family RNA-directed DNA polymerase [Enterobacter cloacae]HDC4291008.1 retron St85 family RNA-directed DNA polymerase [Enterobacter cloacae]